MAYFISGAEAGYFKKEYCSRCVHLRSAIVCPVWALHEFWNEKAGCVSDVGGVRRTALNTLWPRKADGTNDKCAMFRANDSDRLTSALVRIRDCHRLREGSHNQYVHSVIDDAFCVKEKEPA